MLADVTMPNALAADRQADHLPAASAVPNGYLPTGQPLASAGMSDVFALPARPEPEPPLSTPVTSVEPDGLLHRIADALIDSGPAAWVVLAGGALAALLLALVVWRRARRSGVARTGRAVAGPLVLAWEAQGVYQLARLMDVPGPAAAVLACVTATVLITLGAQADEHHKRHGVLGPAMRLMWLVAVPMGLAVALTAHTWAERMLRIILPLLAGVVFVSYYLPDEPADRERKRKLGGFRYTPRRVAVRLGLFEATDADIDTINRQRLVKQMTDLEFARRNSSWEWLRARRALRLDRLSLAADNSMIDEVRANIARAGWSSPVVLPSAAGWAKLAPQMRARQLIAVVEAEHAERVEVAARLDAVLADVAKAEQVRAEQDAAVSASIAGLEAERAAEHRRADEAEQRAVALAEQVAALEAELRTAGTGTPDDTPNDTPDVPGTDTPEAGGTGTRTTRTDAELLRLLRNPRRVPRDADGSVPVKRAARSLGTGPDRARRLLQQAGLLPGSAGTGGTAAVPVLPLADPPVLTHANGSALSGTDTPDRTPSKES